MILKHLIARLEDAYPEHIVRVGFNNPHSYRGYYEDLAFKPVENITVREMLEAAKSALGCTFEGYKGGKFKMSEFSECWLAHWGERGEVIGNVLLDYMLNKVETKKA